MGFSEVICVWANGILAYDTNRDFFFVMYTHYSPKSLQMVTAAMKLKDTCSLEEKLWPT